MLALAHMHKTDGSRHDTTGTCLPGTHQPTQLHQSRRRVSEDIQSAGMFLHRQPDAGLCPRDSLTLSDAGGLRTVEITFHLYPQSLQSSFPYARGHHGDIGDYGRVSPARESAEYGFHSSFVNLQEPLHLEIGSGVDSVQKRPFQSQGDIPADEFPLYGPEALDHDRLPLSPAFVHIPRLIATGGNNTAFPIERCGIPYDHHRKHIHIPGVEIGKSRQDCPFSLPSGLPDVTYRSGGASTLKEKLLETPDLPIATNTPGIIHGCDEITVNRSLYPSLDKAPRSHQIAQGDHTEVMAHRGSEKRCGLLKGTDSRHNLHLHAVRDTSLPESLHHKGSHAVDICVSGAYHCHVSSGKGYVEGHVDPLGLLPHASPDNLHPLASERPYQRQIVTVTHDHPALPDCLHSTPGHIARIARTYAHYRYFSFHILLVFTVIQ